MRKFIITSPSFTGSAEIVFNTAGVLSVIDISQTNMTGYLVDQFKHVVPAQVDLLESAFKKSKATIVEADYEVNFEMFWEKYNKKINKKRCLPIWDKLSKPKKLAALMGIVKYDRFLAYKGNREKLDPENYLRNEAWENEWR
ncbi:MAG TPA: hypothetical protein PKM63_21795 [Panacibacter sp.]|nr:hypothetical protein [Panacibacter sp.]HNP46946.1 hypothetical protein [Panacibacter sp.]